MYYCLLLCDCGCDAPKVSVWKARVGAGGGRGKPGRGLFTLEEARTIDGELPAATGAATGAPMGHHNTNIGGDVFLHGEGGEGGTGTACWELMRKAGGGPSGVGP